MMPSTSKLNQQERNWLDLPFDVTANILARVGMVDILENAQKVCTAWRKICKDPATWRVINMSDIPRSCASMLSIEAKASWLISLLFGPTILVFFHMLPIDQVSLGVSSWTTDALMKFPLLEELNVYDIEISKEEIETVGRYCPLLKTLKVNRSAWRFRAIDFDEGRLTSYNEIAIAIGQNLLELRHLELIGNNMTNIGLQVILDNCHHLETLDLRDCCYVNLKGDLRKQFSKQIKYLKRPSDSLEGCPYIYVSYGESSDEDHYDFGDNENFYDFPNNEDYNEFWRY